MVRGGKNLKRYPGGVTGHCGGKGYHSAESFCGSHWSRGFLALEASTGCPGPDVSLLCYCEKT